MQCATWNPRLPAALRPGAGLCGETLLGHQPLAGPLRRGVADESKEDSGYDPYCGDDRVPSPCVCRVRIDVAEERVADEDERQERYHHLPRRNLPLAREEEKLRGPDGRERVHEKQDQGAYSTRRHEQLEGDDAEHEPAED